MCGCRVFDSVLCLYENMQNKRLKLQSVCVYIKPHPISAGVQANVSTGNNYASTARYLTKSHIHSVLILVKHEIQTTEPHAVVVLWATESKM